LNTRESGEGYESWSSSLCDFFTSFTYFLPHTPRYLPNLDRLQLTFFPYASYTFYEKLFQMKGTFTYFRRSQRWCSYQHKGNFYINSILPVVKQCFAE
jgi:hypothetical protein